MLVALFTLILLTSTLTSCGRTTSDEKSPEDDFVPEFIWLLDNPINTGDINRIQFVQAMGNPAYGANSKIITEQSEIAGFIGAFNGAVVGDEVRREDVGIGSPSTIILFGGDTIVHQFFFNVNDTDRVFLNSRFYYVKYPDLTPFELYLESSAEVIVVDENLIVMEHP
jgi:hypothetical protein